ncbi:hypothetical protein [Rosenbergiella collisarenosi]|uniref:hypothetical protein n=1 Tax=Rosenbergiella collisarenosi TaxID=1544695 RepID=UPI001F4E12E4|nr:hypothetical protein [Rosenbergiella collisarenosi]
MKTRTKYYFKFFGGLLVACAELYSFVISDANLEFGMTVEETKFWVNIVFILSHAFGVGFFFKYTMDQLFKIIELRHSNVARKLRRRQKIQEVSNEIKERKALDKKTQDYIT